MIDLQLVYKIMNWHAAKADNKHVGLFIPLPSNVAKQFPEDGREGEDSSPEHITLVYIGEFHNELEDKLKNIVQIFASKTKPFSVKLVKPKKFVNDEGQTVLYSPVKSSKLNKLHYALKQVLRTNQIPLNNKYPEYKPHVTIEYVSPEEKPKYRDLCPKGEWTVDAVWIWGASEPYMIHLGR